MPFLVQMIVVLVVIGVALYLISNVIPMDPAIKTIVRAVVLLVVLFWVLNLFFPLGTFTVLRH